ncbi:MULTISPECIES: O-antigen ligase family protein [unclassified Campylobacter]|uniref:O-antigen ligase family protein n=1 Tax=unclassified Campylobacter TaxID=2593542 RepID=UPI0022E9A41D|nr:MULTISPECIES: O-antigen ligase family protein [unclassified Campylobacter]MDA3061757.1 O-antigen ligase family protein [Campylobacter sp. JMF_14 EL1]MDA3073137.1 O-antigen ligase family protein [Campylobacter sp. JMF_10 EL2]
MITLAKSAKFSIDKVLEWLIYLLSVSFFFGKAYNVVAGLIIVLFLVKVIKERNFAIFRDKFFIFISIWSLYMFSTIIWASHKGGIASGAGVIFAWSLLYLAVVSTLNSKEKLERFFKLQAFIVLFIAFNCLLQFVLGKNLFGTPILADRATDLLTNTTRKFPYIVPLYVGVFGVMLILRDRLKSHYLLYLVALISIFVSIVLSGIRGSLVILVLFLPFIVFSSPHRKYALGAFVFFCVGVGAILLSSDKLQSRFATLAHPFENQKHYRVAIYKTAFEMIKDNPILGVGFKNFRHREYEYYKPEFQSYEIDPKNGKFVHHAHSPWLDVLSEQGAVGLCFMLTLFAYVFFCVFKRGVFMFIGAFSVFYAFSFFHSTFALSNSRWSFFMIFAVTIYAVISKYYKILHENGERY